MINDLINIVPMYSFQILSKKERLRHSILQLYYAAVSKKTGMLPEHVEDAVKNNRIRHDIYSIERSIDFFHENDPTRDLFRYIINEFKSISKMKKYRVADMVNGPFKTIYDSYGEAMDARRDWVLLGYFANLEEMPKDEAMEKAEGFFRIVDAATGEEVSE